MVEELTQQIAELIKKSIPPPKHAGGRPRKNPPVQTVDNMETNQSQDVLKKPRKNKGIRTEAQQRAFEKAKAKRADYIQRLKELKQKEHEENLLKSDQNIKNMINEHLAKQREDLENEYKAKFEALESKVSNTKKEVKKIRRKPHRRIVLEEPSTTEVSTTDDEPIKPRRKVETDSEIDEEVLRAIRQAKPKNKSYSSCIRSPYS